MTLEVKTLTVALSRN